MVTRATGLTTTRPIIDNSGSQTQEMRSWSRQVTKSVSIIGEGSPEGVVEAELYQVYINMNGVTGSITWIKMQDEIGGDITKGWVLQ